MKYPTNAVLKINSAEERSALESMLMGQEIDVSTLDEFRKRLEFQSADSSKESRVVINGQEVAVGTLEDMQKRFVTECGMHSGSSVAVQQLINGSWKQIAARRVQSVRPRV